MRISNAITEFFIARSDLSPHTLADYRQYLRRWVSWAGDITTQDLQAFMAYVSNEYQTQYNAPLGQSGLANCWTALRSFWRWASESREYLENVALPLKIPQVPQPVVIPFTKAEVQKLIQACFHTALANTREGRRAFRYERHEGTHDVAIILTLLDTGIRLGELQRLDVGDIDLREACLQVRAHRSGLKSRPRVIPFCRDTQASLLRWFTQRKESGDEPLTRDGDLPDSAPVWISLGRRSAGERLNGGSIRQMLRRLGERAGDGDA